MFVRETACSVFCVFVREMACSVCFVFVREMACSVCLLERRPVLCVCLRDGLSCVFVRETACSVCCVPVAKYGTKAQRAMACDCVLCVCAGGLSSPDGGPTQCQEGWQAVLKTST